MSVGFRSLDFAAFRVRALFFLLFLDFVSLDFPGLDASVLKAWRPGSLEAGWLGGWQAWKLEGLYACGLRGLEDGRFGGWEAGRLGGLEAWMLGSLEA